MNRGGDRALVIALPFGRRLDALCRESARVETAASRLLAKGRALVHVLEGKTWAAKKVATRAVIA